MGNESLRPLSILRAAPALAAEWDVCGDERAAVGGAGEPKLAVEDGEPVRESDEAGAVGAGAADAIVADPELYTPKDELPGAPLKSLLSKA